MRHGIAVPDSSDNPLDPPLTQEGEQLIRQEARGLASLGLRIDAIAASPMRRAHRTAEIIAETLGLSGGPLAADSLSPGCSLASLVTLGGFLEKAHGALLVGHHPDLGNIAGALMGASQGLSLSRGGLCVLEVAGWPPQPPARLVMKLPPQVLAGLA